MMCTVDDKNLQCLQGMCAGANRGCTGDDKGCTWDEKGTGNSKTEFSYEQEFSEPAVFSINYRLYQQDNVDIVVE